MIDMNGNPHHSLAVSTMDALAKAGPIPVSHAQPYVEQCQVLAMLSLAYEQRTANLIAYVDKIDDTSAAIPVVHEIKSRLGIAEEAKP